MLQITLTLSTISCLFGQVAAIALSPHAVGTADSKLHDGSRVLMQDGQIHNAGATIAAQALPDVCRSECSTEFVEGLVPHVTLVTIAIGLPASHLAWLKSNREREGRAFGYELCTYTNPDCLPRTEHKAWAKIAAIRQLLAEGREVVVMIDADAWITNPTPFEQFFKPHFDAGKSMVLSQDCANTGLWGQTPKIPGGLNTGVIVTKGDAQAQGFWTAIWETDRLEMPQWWEQSAMLQYIGHNPKEFDLLAVRLDPKAMNTCPTRYEDGDFIFHAYDTNMTFTQRIEYLHEHFG
jgi:hypothetical protein